MAYDLGDVVALAVTVKDSTGAAANATNVALTITLPDGTTTAPTVTNTATGSYSASYTPTMAGRHLVRWVATGSNASAFTDVFDVDDPADLSLVSLAEVKAYLNITSSSTDEELRGFILWATDISERLTSRTLRRRTLTETQSGSGFTVSLNSQPIISVTSVTENGTALTENTDFVVDTIRGVIYRGTTTNSRYWKPGNDNISITYVAGELNPNPTARLLVLETCRHLWRTQRGASPMAMGGDEQYLPGQANIVTYRMKELAELLTIPTVA